MSILSNTQQLLGSWSWPLFLRTSVTTAPAVVALYILGLVVYRLYFSPLAKFPGPKIAAATGWFEAYYQLVKDGGGQFTFLIAKLHKEYGPIVRINPHEIHIQDPEFYETIYSQGQSIDKPSYFEQQFGTPGAVFGTVKHELHRQRRSVLLPFFSKRKVTEQVPHVYQQIEKICSRLQNEYVGTHKILNLCNLFSCFTADVITSYSFDRSLKSLDAPDFVSPFTECINNFKAYAHYSIQFPWLPILMAKLPDSWLGVLQPQMVPIFQFKKAIRNQIEEIMKDRANGKDDRSQGTIFTEVLDSDLPPQEMAVDRLMDEASGVVGAAVETTRWALVVTFFHIINNPAVLKRLREELAQSIPATDETPPLSTLESIPYLMACIQEGIRLAYGSVARSPRIHRRKALVYGRWVIPPGTPVSSDSWGMHHDESVFPDSFSYKPERWLNDPKGPDRKKPLSRYLASFSKGTRMCLGLQLGYAELEIAVAMLLRKFDFELYETTRKDVDCYRDLISVGVHPDSKGVRVLVKNSG